MLMEPLPLPGSSSAAAAAAPAAAGSSTTKKRKLGSNSTSNADGNHPIVLTSQIKTEGQCPAPTPPKKPKKSSSELLNCFHCHELSRTVARVSFKDSRTNVALDG